MIDSNNGAYNGQIQIDTSSLSNSGRWVSYSEGVLQIPLVVTLNALSQSATTSQTATAAMIQTAQISTIEDMRKQFAVGLKNGHYQLIHSLSVEYNNTSVVQLTPYLNHYVNYKLMTTLSQGDLDKWGTGIGFYPDSWESHDYDISTNSAPSGKGSVNNKNLPNEGFFYTDSTSVRKGNFNRGFNQRSWKCINQPTTATTSAICNETDLNNLGRNYYRNSTTTGTSKDIDSFFVVAQIRLKDICDFFDKLPLTRGAYMRLLINTNTSEHKLNYIVKRGSTSGDPNYVKHLNCTSTTITGGSTPLLVASGDGPKDQTFTQYRSQGGDFFTQSTVGIGTSSFTSSNDIEFQFTARASIVKDTTLSITHPTFQNCRLYVPLYTMTNEEVKRYLTLQPTKHIVYRDIFQYQFDVEASNGSFNQLLTNGIANPKALILIPYLHSSENPVSMTGGNAGGSGTSNEVLGSYLPPYQSPFASEPGTTSPYVGIRDFNVQLAGVNIYTSNTLYDFEAFRNELARINGINGGVVDGLMSGLIGQEQFQTNMRYYVVDLSRRIKAEDVVPKSIQVSGTNASQKKMTIFCFLEFEKSVDVALDSGLMLG